MKITDNFLEKSEFENINKAFHLSNFPWYFMPFKVHEGDENYQFYHLFLAKGKVLSKHFDILHPVLKKLGVKEIIRIKANLTLKQKEHIKSDMHIDFGNSTGYISINHSTTEEFRFTDGGAFHADDNITAYSTTVASDRRLKREIQKINYGLKDILKLNSVQFNWREKRKGKHDIGFIAQEVQEIIPEIVNEIPDLENKDAKGIQVKDELLSDLKVLLGDAAVDVLY